MKLLPLLVLVLSLAGCSLFGPAKGPQTRADARAFVLALAAGVDAAAESCAAYVDSSHDLAVKQKCVDVLLPASKAAEAMAAAVDGWSAADQSQLGCLAASVVFALDDVGALLKSVGVLLPAAVEDAVSLARGLAPSCPSLDSGA